MSNLFNNVTEQVLKEYTEKYTSDSIVVPNSLRKSQRLYNDEVNFFKLKKLKQKVDEQFLNNENKGIYETVFGSTRDLDAEVKDDIIDHFGDPNANLTSPTIENYIWFINRSRKLLLKSLEPVEAEITGSALINTLNDYLAQKKILLVKQKKKYGKIVYILYKTV